jgi:hypothetical protein
VRQHAPFVGRDFFASIVASAGSAASNSTNPAAKIENNFRADGRKTFFIKRHPTGADSLSAIFLIRF